MRQRKVQVPSLQGATYNGQPAPGWTSLTVFKCVVCKRIRQSTDAFTSGYGIEKRGKREVKICFACCGDRDRKRLETESSITLYLVRRKDKYRVTNWPGTLDLHAYVREGRHNIAGKRFDVWFSYSGVQWHGVNLGDNDILRCKRVKSH